LAISHKGCEDAELNSIMTTAAKRVIFDFFEMRFCMVIMVNG
jgi:hypothetical protein